MFVHALMTSVYRDWLYERQCLLGESMKDRLA